jgi:N-acetylneuraminic acid mutarotase
VAAVVVSGVKATGGPAVPSDVFSDRAPGANPAQSAPTDPAWRVEAQMPTPRTRLAVASHNGEMVVIGGDTPAGVTDAVERFDATANTWKAGASKPTAVSNVSAAVISDTIYVPGGMTAPGVPTAIVEAYDARADAWTRVAALPAPRMAYAIAASRGKLYVLGGWDGSAFASSTYVYDPASDAWNARAPMIAPRGFSAAAVLGDAIYVVGGFDGQVESSVCERYRPRVDRWEVCPSMSVGRGGLALVSVGTNLYAIGGGWTGYLAFNETLTPESGSWRVISTPDTGQWRGLGAAVIDSDIFVVGGWNGQYLANTVRYRPFPFKIFVPGVQDSSPP